MSVFMTFTVLWVYYSDHHRPASSAVILNIICFPIIIFDCHLIYIFFMQKLCYSFFYTFLYILFFCCFSMNIEIRSFSYSKCADHWLTKCNQLYLFSNIEFRAVVLDFIEFICVLHWLEGGRIETGVDLCKIRL